MPHVKPGTFQCTAELRCGVSPIETIRLPLRPPTILARSLKNADKEPNTLHQTALPEDVAENVLSPIPHQEAFYFPKE